jgi:nucleoside-triphosphatase THEP1
MIFIVTGGKDAGKTTFAHDVILVLQKKGFVVCGFLSIGKQVTDRRKQFDLFDLAERKSWPLAEPEKKQGYMPCGRYYFNPGTVDRGEAIVRTAISDKADLVVMDEIGKCELLGKIWDSVFRFAIAAGSNLLIVVSKKNLTGIISNYGFDNYLLFDLSEATVEQSVAGIVSQTG